MRITIQEVKTALGITNTYDIVNAISNSLGTKFSDYVGLASQDNVVQIGQALQQSQTLQNDFITSLIDRIGLVVVKHAGLTNPLAKFKKGMMPEGRTIEEIFTDITIGQKYNPADAEQTLFKRTIPNVKTLFHEMNRQDFYTQTVQDSSLQTAFTSWSNFENFVSSIINAIYNSAEVEEYEYMRLLVDNYYSKGLFTVVPLTAAPTDQTSATDFIKKVRATTTKMTLPNGTRDYNALAVRQRSDISDLHLIIDADTNAEIDVDVLARAFNMDKTNFLSNVTVIDGFASSGLVAVLVDKNWFMVYDKLQKLETVRNPKGLYWNYFFHIWQVLSVSRFENAVAFAVADSNLPAVTSVVLSPTINSQKQGSSFEYTAYVRATDGKTHTVTWHVNPSTSSTTLKTGTTIDANGNLTVDPTQTGELSVTASVDISAAQDGSKLVTGESIVTIIPA
jgi:hypothetical protein